uniref:Uncharacterized protein n=1 Tax=Lepeophtheirus salmonis TaxID=72036 RepID=A0A0K2TUW5_LEPSM
MCGIESNDRSCLFISPIYKERVNEMKWNIIAYRDHESSIVKNSLVSFNS